MELFYVLPRRINPRRLSNIERLRARRGHSFLRLSMLCLRNDASLLINVPDLAPAEAVTRFRGLADIERCFRVLKADIEIASVLHRLPDRIRAMR